MAFEGQGMKIAEAGGSRALPPRLRARSREREVPHMAGTSLGAPARSWSDQNSAGRWGMHSAIEMD